MLFVISFSLYCIAVGLRVSCFISSSDSSQKSSAQLSSALSSAQLIALFSPHRFWLASSSPSSLISPLCHIKIALHLISLHIRAFHRKQLFAAGNSFFHRSAIKSASHVKPHLLAPSFVMQPSLSIFLALSLSCSLPLSSHTHSLTAFLESPHLIGWFALVIFVDLISSHHISLPSPSDQQMASSHAHGFVSISSHLSFFMLCLLT